MGSLRLFTSEFKFNFELAAPVMLANAATVFVGLVDNFMIAKMGGHAGEVGLAAAALGNAIFLLVLLIGIGISTGMTPLVAYYDAEKDQGSLNRIFRSGFWLNLVTGFVFAAILYFGAPLLHLPVLKQDPEVVAIAIPYLRIVGMSLIPVMIIQSYKQFADGLAYTWIGMAATLLANVINTGCNYGLIYGNWGLPEMGAVGAGLGTFISRMGAMFFIILIYRFHPVFRKYLSLSYFKLVSVKFIKKILNIGVPSGMQSLFEVGAFSSATIIAGMFGSAYQSAHQIAIQFSGLVYVIASGLGVAATIRVGYYFGVRKFLRIRSVATSLLMMTGMIVVVCGVALFAFREIIPAFFIDSEQVVSIAMPLFIMASVHVIFDGVQITSLGALRGLQDVKIPTLITFIGYWLIGLPISYALAVYADMKAIGIWVGLACGLLFCSIMLTTRFYVNINKRIGAVRKNA